MQNRTLGKDLEESAVDLGCMGFVNLYETAMDAKSPAFSAALMPQNKGRRDA